jgi:hypothetical protein
MQVTPRPKVHNAKFGPTSCFTTDTCQCDSDEVSKTRKRTENASQCLNIPIKARHQIDRQDLKFQQAESRIELK